MLGKPRRSTKTSSTKKSAQFQPAIEPVLMVVMAIFAGGMVAAILFPIYNLVGGIQ